MYPSDDEINKHCPTFKAALEDVFAWKSRDPNLEHTQDYVQALKAIDEAWKSLYRLGIRRQLMEDGQ